MAMFALMHSAHRHRCFHLPPLLFLLFCLLLLSCVSGFLFAWEAAAHLSPPHPRTNCFHADKSSAHDFHRRFAPTASRKRFFLKEKSGLAGAELSGRCMQHVRLSALPIIDVNGYLSFRSRLQVGWMRGGRPCF